MRKHLLPLFSLMCIAHYTFAQPATFSNPLGIGRNNCSGAGGADSLYYLNYVSPNLSNSVTPITACRPVLRTNFPPLSGYAAANKPFVIFNASIAFNPADSMIYYVWTDYNIAPPYKSYIWRWSSTTCPMPAAPGLDTFRTFNTDIGGITFDANGLGWQLEFSGSAPFQGRLRQVNFTTGAIGIPDTLDLTGGVKLWNVGTGDITLTPSGQMYFIFNNKLFTPDYQSAGGPTKHIKCTYIDTVRLPAGKTGLPGLAFGSGDLIASYSGGAAGTNCIYKRIDPIVGDTASITYTYAANKGVYSTDMTQINSGIGPSKKLVSATFTGTPGQYDIVYDIYTRNYGNVSVSNVQVTDDLKMINGAANLSNVTAVLTSNPAGVVLNPLFNGNTNINLLAAGQWLKAYPVASNNFTIRISCRLSNLLNGVVYNNSAIVTANGYKNVALRDSSTNGSNPDLNQNDKTDDPGEGQPTPFVILLTPLTPPCATLDTTLYNQDFGSGVGLNAIIPPSASVPSATSTYTGTATAPLPINRFTVTNNASLGDPVNWISLTDHTGGANGRMLVINADASANIMYRDTLPVSCSGQQYSVSFWAAFIGNSAYQTVCDGLGGFKYPMILVRIRDMFTGLTITQYTTDTIKLTSWQLHGMKWVMPPGYTNVILELVNAAPGGCGNDLAIDDIKYGICDPLPTVSLSNPGGTCLGSSVTFTANLSDATVIPGPKDYQWQWSPSPGTGPWTNIIGATAATYIINPVNPVDTGKYYRVIVAAQGNIGVVTCQYISPGAKLVGVVPSVSPTSISSPSTTFCNPGSVTLTAVGGTLGTGANYQWGTGAVIGVNPIGGATNSTLTVSPVVTTTYWVRIENTTSPCSAITGGVTVMITVNQPSVAPASITGTGFCNPGSATLTAVGGTLGTGANYQWGTGAVVGVNPIGAATSSTLTVSPVVTTTYWVRIENTTAPCTATTAGITKLITVTQPSVAPTSITAPSTAFCGSGSTTLTAVGGALGTGANYQWGTGAVVGVNPIGGATSSTLAVTVFSTTTYWVRIENTTAPCSSTTGGVTVTITVSQPSTAPASVTGADFCNPGSTTLTAVGGALGTGANYQWGTGAVVGVNPIGAATSSTLTVSPVVTTTYWVRIENTFAPCTATTAGVTKLVTVSQPSVAATSANKNKNNICPGISVNLSVVGGTLGTNASWKWYTGACGTILVGTGAGITVTPIVTTTYYVRAEGDCNTTTCQPVTVTISCDIDKDDDGIPDLVESNIAAAFADANGNGVINAYDPTYPGFVDNNNDFIDDDFQADGDSDNDGIPNYLDPTFPGRIDTNGDGVDDRFDADKDGKINMIDLDSDNDGIPDVVEAYGVDANGNGKIDNFIDADGDGLSDNVDTYINVSNGAYNTGLGLGRPDLDGDGIPNFVDLDSDNDGIPDVVEAGGPDINNNGIIDGFVDVNGDGLHDGYINGTALLITGIDGNGDGRADSWPNKNMDRDLRPNAYDMDSDGDGIVDVIEAGLPDANLDGIVDGVIAANGWSTTVSAMPALNLRSTDGDGKPDYLDIDSDGDGIPDNIEGQSTAGYLLPGITDTDGDGLVNTYDNIVGFGGSGIFVYDHDADGTPDYRDLDTDADGQPDIIEGNDFNLNGIADDNVTPTGLDTDGDGLDDRFDSLNSVINIKGTSYMMGNGGSVIGDPAPGAKCTVQSKTVGQINRDWRFVGFILPVQFLQLTGTLQGSYVILNWTVIAAKDVDHFEVERSTDNNNYFKTGTVLQQVKINEQKSFAFTDDVANVNKDIIYYRIKVIGKAGEIQYSNIILIRRQQSKTGLSLMPNPARDYVSILFFAEKESDVTIRMIDNMGKSVMLEKQKVIKGNNTLQLRGLDKYSNGVYSLQLFVNGEVITQKLVLAK